MITLNRINIKNYLSIEKADIEVTRGSWLITGVNEDNDISSNGAGKSAILDAITYATYGRTVRKINKGDLVSHWASSTDVSVEWEVDGIKYLIERGHKRSGGSYLNVVGDETISFPNQNDAQNFIDELLGMDFDIFCRTVLISQSLYSLFAESSPAEKVRLIEQILNWGYFDEAQKLVGQYETRSGRLADKLQIKENTASAEIRRIDGELREREVLLDSTRKRIESSRKKAEKDMEEIEKGISVLMNKKRYVEDQLGENTKKVGKLNINMNECERDIKRLHSLIDKQKDDLFNIQDVVGEDCPYCGREMDEKYLGTVRDSKQKDIDKMAGEMDIEALKKLDLTEEHDNYMKTGKRFQLELNEIDEEIQILISSKPEDVSDGDLAIIEDAIKQLEKNRVRWESKGSFAKEWIRIVNDRLKIYSFWKKGFSPAGMRNIMLSSVVDHLSTKSTNYANYLFSESVEVRLSGDKTLASGDKKISLNIRVILDGEDRDYNALSGGQRRRVDISIIFALRDIVQGQRRIGILLLDEALDHLDMDGSANLVPLLESMTQDSTVMLVTHRKDFSDMEWDHKLTVKRNQGRARVEVSNAEAMA